MESEHDPDALPRGARANASVYGRILYWDPETPICSDKQGMPPTGLTIAYIGSPELHRDLVCEADVHILTPHNYREVLLYGNIDFILFESSWDCLVPAWYQSHRPESPSHRAFQAALDLAKQVGCPSVFWLTKGAIYVDEYAETAKRFDRVFASDVRSVELLRAHGVPSGLLEASVQPRIFNPFRHLQGKVDSSFPVLFDGWADFERDPSASATLEALANRYGLAIVESRYRVPAARVHTVPSLAPHIEGVLTEATHPLALQRAKIVVSFSDTLSSYPMQHQRALQAAACKALPVHVGALEETDARRQFVHVVDDQKGLFKLLDTLDNSPTELERRQHRAWRKAVGHSTLRHRLKTIAESLGVGCEWVEWPLVSVVAPTCRPENVSTVIENFDRQNYTHKELVIVINGEPSVAKRLQMEYSNRSDIVWDSVPSDRFTGSALNRANLKASAELAVKMDDDDIYGANHLADIIISLRCYDADVFGKVPAPILFEGDDVAYQRRLRFGAHAIAYGRDLTARRLWLGGNTLGWRRPALPVPLFADDLIGAVDSIFNENLPADTRVLVLDSFNVVTVRKMDPEQHTWRHDKEMLLAHSEVAGPVEDLLP